MIISSNILSYNSCNLSFMSIGIGSYRAVLLGTPACLTRNNISQDRIRPK